MVFFTKQSRFILSRILSSKFETSFQGQYKNSSQEIVDCQGQPSCVQSRTFFSLPKVNCKRVYCGRQLIGYTMNQMYEVVSDVGNYHKFLPWCTQSLILNRTPQHLKAKLTIGFPPIRESYTSYVTLLEPHLVKAECKDTRLFNHLLTIWRFSPGLKREERSCVVDFQITFDMRSAFHVQLSNLFFDQVARQMEDAFINEACRRHGPATMPPKNLLLNNNILEKS